MATENRRVAAYLSEDLDSLLEKFKTERGIKGDSQALSVILAEFFGVSQKVTHQSSSNFVDRLDSLEERIGLLKSEILSELKSELNKSISDVKSDLLIRLKSELRNNPTQQLELIPGKGDSSSELESEPPILQPLQGTRLSKRFGLHPKVVTNNRNDWKNEPGRFTEWSRKKDPDGIAWKYNEETKLFHPLIENLAIESTP